MMAQVPALIAVAVRPETVHTPGVSEVNEGVAVVTDDALNVTFRPTVVSDGWSKVIVCGRLAGPSGGGRTSAAAVVTWARGRSTVRPPTTAARRQHPRNARSLDQRTVEREVALPASLLRSRTLPLGRTPMTALPASSRNVPYGNQSVIREVSRHAHADTCPGRRRIFPRFPRREV